MKHIFTKPAALAVIAAASGLPGACSDLEKSLDVVGKASVDSFEALLKAVPDNVSADKQNAGWSLKAPDGSARFFWSADYGKSPLYDVFIQFDAKPFVDAGLDTAKLPADIKHEGDLLTVGADLGSDTPAADASTDALAAYKMLVDKRPDVIGYHASLGHYGVSLGGGNLFEWAKDMATNDKDIVFVLDPAVWIGAGVDPGKIQGWVFGKVTVDVDGKPTEVDKILKPFDLK
ncbi:MAG: hypothetical protein LBR29_00500 [Methylobacteriaceae bacterium]|jgi:hypothetical protein|nr:hypothetical protein [Methylobacteriaceae bacterium]